ncbi:MAG: clostripain-related cysteine peptidase [Muribaculum sp.]|nr:clostripain-related cysteine peptidase [Muribaculum sp.]
MNRYIFAIITTISMLAVTSCRQDELPKETAAKRTVLIYAVASNNLDSYLQKDIDEMLQAAPDIHGLGKNVNVLLYSVDGKSATEATLARLVETSGGNWGFQTLKSYDRKTFSTDPVRMRQVFADVRSVSPSENYGLVFWSHGTGWFPDFNTHQVPGMQRSFGWDTYQGVTDKCDLIELADAVPDRMFDYIWFDVCYMMGIEVAYQLRNKCDFIAGYPTEDWSPGMNYDVTLPMLAALEPDLKGAAKAFFDYYNNSNMAVTVSLISTSGLDRLAAAASDIYKSGIRPGDAFGMQDYGRSPYRGLYDFGQFTRAYLSNIVDNTENGQLKTENLTADFNAALSEVLLYGGCSSKDFYGNANAFNPDIYSGFSCHFPGTSSADKEEYFRSLDWTKATNP